MVTSEICRGFFFRAPIFASICRLYLGVSKNNGTPKSSILRGFSIINHPFWGTPIFLETSIYSAHLPTIGKDPFFEVSFSYHIWEWKLSCELHVVRIQLNAESCVPGCCSMRLLGYMEVEGFILAAKFSKGILQRWGDSQKLKHINNGP